MTNRSAAAHSAECLAFTRQSTEENLWLTWDGDTTAASPFWTILDEQVATRLADHACCSFVGCPVLDQD